jgi:hypothetical protein
MHVTRRGFRPLRGCIIMRGVIRTDSRSYELAATLANWSRILPATRRCSAALEEASDDPRASALRLWLRGGFKRRGDQKRQRAAQALAAQHSDVLEPTLVDAALTYRLGPDHHGLAISVLERKSAAFGELPAYRATIAAFLAQRGRYAAAWERYRSALSDGGIPSPAHRASAYRCAVKANLRSEGQQLLLSKVGAVQRLSIQLTPLRRPVLGAWLAGLAVGAVFHLWLVMGAVSAFTVAPGLFAYYGLAGPFALPLIPLTVLLGWGLFDLSRSFSPGGPLLFVILVLLGGPPPAGPFPGGLRPGCRRHGQARGPTGWPLARGTGAAGVPGSR